MADEFLGHDDIDLEMDDLDDLSFDEVDGLLISEYQDWPVNDRKPPRSSMEGVYWYAHENPGAWDHYWHPTVTKEAAKLALEADAGLDQALRHLPGKHNQQSHGKGGTAVLARPAVRLSDEKATELHGRLSEPDGGFTVNPRTGNEVTKGFAVAAYPERSKEIPFRQTSPGDIKSYVDNNADLLSKDGNMLGGWHDPETGNVWLDVSIVTPSKSKAMRLAREHNQIAIFDLENFESIDTGGTGK